MSSANDAAALAKAFEPILLFHKDERFFPIDPKWYLERCALWKSDRPFDDKTKWNQPPVLAKGLVAAANGAKEIAGGKTWLGTPGGAFGIEAATAVEQRPADQEFFLEFAGWEPVSNPAVTPTTNNRHAALNPAEYLAPLQGSQPWYYVEYLDNADLLAYTDNPNIKANGLNLFSIVASNPKLNAPRVILYHLLYPLHQETLEGCEDAGEGRLFGSYAGEWACVAVVIDATGKPLFIGLTSRNTAAPALHIDQEQRVGMTIMPWSDVQTVSDAAGAHPKIFVSLDTHGHYLTSGPKTLTPFTPGGLDIARMSCGQVETLDDLISGDTVISPGTPAIPEEDANAFVITLKILLSVATLGIGTKWIAGDWATAEGAWGNFRGDGTPEILASPHGQATDVTGGPSFGRILRPKGLALPEAAQATSVEDWNVRAFFAPAPDGRAYGFVVDRFAQVWWAPRPEPRPAKADLKNPKGFGGRWGPRVTNDPHARRAGMKCPDFALLLLEALATNLNH